MPCSLRVSDTAFWAGWELQIYFASRLGQGTSMGVFAW